EPSRDAEPEDQGRDRGVDLEEIVQCEKPPHEGQEACSENDASDHQRPGGPRFSPVSKGEPGAPETIGGTLPSPGSHAFGAVASLTGAGSIPPYFRSREQKAPRASSSCGTSKSGQSSGVTQISA